MSEKQAILQHTLARLTSDTYSGGRGSRIGLDLTVGQGLKAALKKEIGMSDTQAAEQVKRYNVWGIETAEHEQGAFVRYEDHVQAVADAERRGLQRGDTFLREIADQLERWANESRTGGWSTHQVDPQRALAARIYQYLGRQKATHGG